MQVRSASQCVPGRCVRATRALYLVNKKIVFSREEALGKGGMVAIDVRYFSSERISFVEVTVVVEFRKHLSVFFCLLVDQSVDVLAGDARG